MLRWMRWAVSSHLESNNLPDVADTRNGQVYSDDQSMSNDNGCKIFVDRMHEALAKFGRFPATIDWMKESMEKAGFVDVHFFRVKQPLGPWPKNEKLKKIGAMVRISS